MMKKKRDKALTKYKHSNTEANHTNYKWLRKNGGVLNRIQFALQLKNLFPKI